MFEQNITEKQLSELEDSQLTFIDYEKPKHEARAVSYYEWQEQSNKPKKMDPEQTKPADIGTLKRLFNRFAGKS